MKKLNLPLNKNDFASLKAGEEVVLNGIIYTARDQAHKRLVEAIKKKQKLPIDLVSAVIYYCGPTQARKGKIIGSCGPTTSSRMDEFTAVLLKAGLYAMIGKGNRSQEVVNVIKQNKAIYFLTYAGCGALLSKYIKTKKLAAYGDLGPEAICQLEVENFPAIVAIDTKGNNIYKKANTKIKQI